MTNSSFIQNEAGLEGGAIAVDWKPGSIAFDPNHPLGGEYDARLIGNTFAQNTGGSQLYFQPGNGNAPFDTLFINNIVSSSNGVDACHGWAARLIPRRYNDLSQVYRNAMYPAESCGPVDMKTSSTALGMLGAGWYFQHEYMPTSPALAGDLVTCTALGGVDQFDNSRQCLMGSVEAAPGPVQPPFIP